MRLAIDRKKLPIKYALEVYKMVDGYPSSIDILYELVGILEDRASLYEEFTCISVIKEVSTRETSKDLEESLTTLSNDGWLIKTKEKYRLSNHPWIAETNSKL